MQDYKMLVRTVYGGATVEQNGVVLLQNLMETQDYLNEVYLSNGYHVLSVDYLGEFALDPGNSASPQGMRFAWHLAKDVK